MTKRFGLAAAFLAGLLNCGAANADPVTISFLTHWPPETVAKLKAATDAYSKSHADVKIEIRAVPFGDLLTTSRAQGSSANGATSDGIYDLWLPELVRDKLAAPVPAELAADVA